MFYVQEKKYFTRKLRAKLKAPQCAVALVLLLAAPCPALRVDDEDLTVVRTSEGVLRGNMMTSAGGRLFIAFRGVPYARPPLGVLRWMPPEPPVAWSGVRSAKYDPPVCPQLLPMTDMFTGKEDCLYLNVFTHKDADKVPVLVWIHGGGFQAGDSGIEETGPEFLMDHNLVLVTINYRLGVLGFLSTGDEELPGNYGLKDQVMALVWVQRNIGVFGGDAERVTLFGGGSGAASALYHMLSPLSKGLFHRVVAQSGSPLNPWAFQRKPKETAELLCRLVKCDPSAGMRACLSAAPVERLVETLYRFPYWGARFPMPWAPAVEPTSPVAFLRHDPELLFREGRINYVPVIAGNTKDEQARFARIVHSHKELLDDLDHNFNDVLARLLHTRSLSNETMAQVRAFYFGGEEGFSERALVSFLSDTTFGHGVNRAVRLLAASSPQPVYYYEYDLGDGEVDHAVEAQVDEDPRFFLRMQIPFTMHRLTENKMATNRLVGEMLANFAASGNPTPEGTSGVEVWWPIYRDGNLQYYSIGDTLSMQSHTDEFTRRMNLWDGITYSTSSLMEELTIGIKQELTSQIKEEL